jgi:signal transduction histidine kinase
VSSAAALALYPLWAVALAVGLTALRLGRSVGRGLVIVCFALATWVSGLVLLVSADGAREGALARSGLADRVLPLGMFLAGAFLHAGADIAKTTDRRAVRAGYAFSSVVAALGVTFPGLIYGPGVRGPGPLFYPLAIVSTLGAIASKVWLWRLTRGAPAPQRRRSVALVIANLTATLGGGGAIALRVFGLAPIESAAPFLFLSIVLATIAVVYEEKGRAREVLVQALTFAVLTGLFSAIGLVVFFRLLPRLVPEMTVAWTAFVIFFGALPLDPLRSIAVETIGARLFERPIAIDRLEREIETKETEREQVEGLAEMGRLASAVAHEIRNPLGVILAQTKALERQGAAPDNVAEIRAQVDRAKRFLDDLLRFAKPRPLALRELDVRGVLAMAASNVRQALGRTESAAPLFHLDDPVSSSAGAGTAREDAAHTDAARTDADGASGEAPAIFIEADRGALLDVATILLTNAAIAIEDRPGGAVRATVRDRGRTVEIAITDNGPGVPAEIEPRLFQLFVTGRGRDHKRPGTGIGLALAARWVQRHGGTLRHERPSDGGARFIAEWPKVPITG